MNPYFRTIKAKSQICLLLFVLGGILCVALDIIGIASVSLEPMISSPIRLPISAYIALPVVYAVAGIVIGLLSKRSSDATIYGASLGQCQSILPLITFPLILHSGDFFEIFWRMCCGLPLTLAFAGIAFSLKALIKMLIKKNKS